MLTLSLSSESEEEDSALQFEMECEDDGKSQAGPADGGVSQAGPADGGKSQESEVINVSDDERARLIGVGHGCYNPDSYWAFLISIKRDNRVLFHRKAMEMLSKYAEEENKDKPQAVVQVGCSIHRADRGMCELFYKFYVDPRNIMAIYTSLRGMERKYQMKKADSSLVDFYGFLLARP